MPKVEFNPRNFHLTLLGVDENSTPGYIAERCRCLIKPIEYAEKEPWSTRGRALIASGIIHVIIGSTSRMKNFPYMYETGKNPALYYKKTVSDAIHVLSLAKDYGLFLERVLEAQKLEGEAQAIGVQKLMDRYKNGYPSENCRMSRTLNEFYMNVETKEIIETFCGWREAVKSAEAEVATMEAKKKEVAAAIFEKEMEAAVASTEETQQDRLDSVVEEGIPGVKIQSHDSVPAV